MFHSQSPPGGATSMLDCKCVTSPKSLKPPFLGIVSIKFLQNPPVDSTHRYYRLAEAQVPNNFLDIVGALQSLRGLPPKFQT